MFQLANFWLGKIIELVSPVPFEVSIEKMSTTCSCFKALIGLSQTNQCNEADIDYKTNKILSKLAERPLIEVKVYQASAWLKWKINSTTQPEPNPTHNCNDFEEAKRVIKELFNEPRIEVKYHGKRPASHNIAKSFKIDVLRFTRHDWVKGDLRLSTIWRGFEAVPATQETLDSAMKAPHALKEYLANLGPKSRKALLDKSPELFCFYNNI